MLFKWEAGIVMDILCMFLYSCTRNANVNLCISASFVDICYVYGGIEEVFRTIDVKTPKKVSFLYEINK